MKVTIEYCRVCNYFPIAARLGLDIKNEFGWDVEYEAGGSGVFNVLADGRTVFSKFEAGDRFPEKGEVVRLLKERFGG